MPDPILVGRNAEKLEALAKAHGIARWSTDLDAASPIRRTTSSSTPRRRRCAPACSQGDRRRQAHLLREAVADNAEDALDLARAGEEEAGIKHGVVQDKLFLPGLLKLKMLIDSGFFGRILSVRGEFGYWVFEGDWQPAQRPSWNYRKKPTAAASSSTCSATGATCSTTCSARSRASPASAPRTSRALGRERQALQGRRRRRGLCHLPARRAASIAHINSVLGTRVRRDDLVTFQVDGTHGSAVAGLQKCWTQPRVNTPKPVWNPTAADHRLLRRLAGSADNAGLPDNGFKRAVGDVHPPRRRGRALSLDLLEGAKGVQLAEAGLQELAERRWIDVPALKGGLTTVPCRCPRSEPAEPTAKRRIEARPLSAPPRDFPPATPPSTASPMPPRMWSPIRWPTAIPGSTPANRLGPHHRLPQAPLVARPRRRRGDGHRAARHGPRLGRRAQELIRRSLDAMKDVPGAVIASGAGTDHLRPARTSRRRRHPRL
jgi:predicted dehydrogenase